MQRIARRRGAVGLQRIQNLGQMVVLGLVQRDLHKSIPPINQLLPIFSSDRKSHPEYMRLPRDNHLAEFAMITNE
ncbi:hypothetical protein ACIU1J_24365 [Azospirillum doebereinerae]|uniref:hypothetical protein n=1 Tax=Azospirillum doebereinerae TaxID=92933 RepID=UPI00384AAFA6